MTSEPCFYPQNHFLQHAKFELLMNSDVLSELLCLASLLLFIVLLNEFYLIILYTRINISNTNCNFNTLLSSKPLEIFEVHVRPTLFQQYGYMATKEDLEFFNRHCQGSLSSVIFSLYTFNMYAVWCLPAD
jgi:hypothetical protein